MFKNLKKKLEQGVAQSKAAVSGLAAAAKGDEKYTSTESIGRPVAESTPQKNGSQLDKNMSGSNTPVGQLVDIPLFENADSTSYETASDMSSVRGDETPKGGRSRTSSVSSMTSDSSFFPNVSFSHNYYIPSDVESEIEETSVNLSSVSKEDLYAIIKRLERKASKYRSKHRELSVAFKDMLQEREKLKSTMAQCQDRAFRRMSELREQIQLDKLAKRDLEDNYRLLLDEKDEYMKVLNMQIKLLKEGKDIPEELQAKLTISQAKADAPPPSFGDSKTNISQQEEIEILKLKIKRQDGLLLKCKETITSYKEKVTQLSHDKQELLGKLELVPKSGSNTSLQQSPEQIAKLQNQIQEAKKVIEQLESDREVAIATVKQQVHEEMEKRDAELEMMKSQNQQLQLENNNIKIELEKLENQVDNLNKTNKEQIDKAREIMKKLKEDKMRALEQAEERIRLAEQSMEEEKEKMLSDLKRGKAEAFSVMQLESEKALLEKLTSSLEERDKMWNEKMAAHEEAHNEIILSKEREKDLALNMLHAEIKQKLLEKEEELRLAVEERELQKMAAVSGLDEQKDVLLRKIEELNSEKIELINKLSKLQDDSENQRQELQTRLEGEINELKNKIADLKLQHLAILEEERLQWKQSLKDQIEELNVSHVSELQRLTEQSQQEVETEKLNKSQVETLKSEMDQELNETRLQLEQSNRQLEIVKTLLSETQTKLSTTEQLLGDREKEMSLKEQETSSQLEELFAAINGKGEENDQLKQQLEELQKQFSIKQNEYETTNSTLLLMQEKNGGFQKQVEAFQEESERVQLLIDEKEKLIQESEMLKQREVELLNKVVNLEETITMYTLQSQILSQQLDVMNEELEISRNNMYKQNKVYDQKLEEAKVTFAQDFKNKIQFLEEENERLLKVEQSRKNKIVELEKLTEELRNNVSSVKEDLESKCKASEDQVSELQAIILSLETCQSVVETEKSRLEEKLTSLEDIMEDLKSSKNELHEKLHDSHQTLLEKWSVEKQHLEATASELATQVNTLRKELEAVNKVLVSKDDEIVAMRSVLDDNLNYVKNLETQSNDLSSELQKKTLQEVNLTKTLEKLKAEANAKVKGLKEMKDSLTEQLQLKSKELEDLYCTSREEKEKLVNSCEEKLMSYQESMKSLEESFKIQFQQKQTNYKETLTKLKENFEQKLRDKDTQLEQVKNILSQKEIGMEDMNQTLEKFKEDQIREIQQNHAVSLSELKAEWETKYQSLNESQAKLIESLNAEHQNEVKNMQAQLAQFENESKDFKTQLLTSQSELQIIQSQLHDVQAKYSKELELSSQIKFELGELKEKVKEIHDLENKLQEKEKEILSLTEQLQEKDGKLKSMASTISAEQEYLQKQLDAKAQELDELNSDNVILKKQLKELQGKYRSELEEKDMSLIESNEKLSQLQMEHSSMEEMLKVINDKLQEKEETLTSLQENIQSIGQEKDCVISKLTAQLDQISQDIHALHLKLIQKDQELVEIKEQKYLELEELKKNLENQILLMTSKETEWQKAMTNIEREKNELSEKLQEAIDKTQCVLAEKESQEITFKEQISFLQNQINETQKQVELSSTELQTSLQQRVAECEDKLFYQLQSHQQELEAARLEAETSRKDLKQKYIAKLKEIQNQAKSTIEELEANLKSEKEANTEIHFELTRANTRLLQLEESSGLSHDTIIDLEQKVKLLNEALQLRDSELAKITQNFENSEKKLQQVIDEQLFQEQKAQDKENEMKALNLQILEQKKLLEDHVTVISQLENTITLLKDEGIVLREKHEHELQEKNVQISQFQSDILENNELKNKLELEIEAKNNQLLASEKEIMNKKNECLQLQSIIDKTNTLLHQAQSNCTELESKVQSVSQEHSELEQLKLHQHQASSNLSALIQERDRLLRDVHDSQSQCEKYKNEIDSIRLELSETNATKADMESMIKNLQNAHSQELAEVTSKLESQSSVKIAEYKKKAEVYISQVKKQLQDEKSSSTSQLQDVIAKLEKDLSLVNSELADARLAYERQKIDNEKEFQILTAQVQDSIHSKEELLADFKSQEDSFHQKELALMTRLHDLENEKIELLEKIDHMEHRMEAIEDLKSKEYTDLKTDYINLESLLSSLKEQKENELSALKKTMSEKLEEVEKRHLTVLEEQTGENSSKLKHLLKDCRQQLAEKERDFEVTFQEAQEKSERSLQQIMFEHQADLEELRKELLERDERLQELHVEYKSKLEAAEFEKVQKIKQLEAEIASLILNNKQQVTDLELKLKSENNKNLLAKDTAHLEEVNALTKEWNFERQMGMQCSNVDEQRHEMSKELIQQNQDALSAFQKSLSGNATSLQEQVIFLTRQVEQLKQKHRLELAQAYSSVEMEHQSLAQPLVAAPSNPIPISSQHEISLELQDLELENMDLKAQVYHLNGELSQFKIKERDLIKKVDRMERAAKGIPEDDDPPLNLDGSFSSQGDSALLREPTEFEYLKNILYEYMMGRETRTLTKVIATVIRFSEEQTRNVLSKAESRLKWLPNT